MGLVRRKVNYRDDGPVIENADGSKYGGRKHG
jgi:hypothetical protein